MAVPLLEAGMLSPTLVPAMIVAVPAVVHLTALDDRGRPAEVDADADLHGRSRQRRGWHEGHRRPTHHGSGGPTRAAE
jgi:ABC-type proline/glycine betaine transport system permease subunit